MSRTKQAIQLMKQDGISAYQAAKRMRVTSSAVYAELSRQRSTRVCAHCGSKYMLRQPKASGQNGSAENV